MGDQMICPNGRQWDVTDPEPPTCAECTPVPAPAIEHQARREYLEFIKTKGIIK